MGGLSEADLKVVQLDQETKACKFYCYNDNLS